MQINDSRIDPNYRSVLGKVNDPSNGGDGDTTRVSLEEQKKALQDVLAGKKISDLPQKYQSFLRSYLENNRGANHNGDNVIDPGEVDDVINTLDAAFSTQEDRFEEFFYGSAATTQSSAHPVRDAVVKAAVEMVTPATGDEINGGTLEVSAATPNANGEIASIAAGAGFRTEGGFTAAVHTYLPVPITPDGIKDLSPVFNGGVGLTAPDGKSGVMLGFLPDPSLSGMPATLESYAQGSVSRVLRDNPEAVPVAVAWYTVQDADGNDHVLLQVFGGASAQGHEEGADFFEDMFARHAFAAGGRVEARLFDDRRASTKIEASYVFDAYTRVGGATSSEPDTVNRSTALFNIVQEFKFEGGHTLKFTAGGGVQASTHSQARIPGEVALDATDDNTLNDPRVVPLMDAGIEATTNEFGESVYIVPGIVNGQGAGDYEIRIPFSIGWEGRDVFFNRISLFAEIFGKISIFRSQEFWREESGTHPGTGSPTYEMIQTGKKWSVESSVTAEVGGRLDVSKDKDKSAVIEMSGGANYDSRNKDNPITEFFRLVFRWAFDWWRPRSRGK